MTFSIDNYVSKHTKLIQRLYNFYYDLITLDRFTIISVQYPNGTEKKRTILIRGKALGIFPFVIDLDMDGALDNIINLKNGNIDDVGGDAYYNF